MFTMERSNSIDGTVIAAKHRTVTVQGDDGSQLEAMAPLHWFGAKGRFDMCSNLPVGLRVRIRLAAPPKKHRVIELLD